MAAQACRRASGCVRARRVDDFLGWAAFLLLLVLGLRWLRDNVMWSVRNRLIVTYLFIGGVPVTLAVAIALLSGYLVLGDLAIFSAVSEIKAEASRLGASNAAAEEEITRHSTTPEKIAASDMSFPGRSIAVLPKSSLPGWVRDGFTGWSAKKDTFTCAPRTLTAIPGPDDGGIERFARSKVSGQDCKQGRVAHALFVGSTNQWRRKITGGCTIQPAKRSRRFWPNQRRECTRPCNGAGPRT